MTPIDQCPAAPGCCFWVDGKCLDDHYYTTPGGHPRCRPQTEGNVPLKPPCADCAGRAEHHMTTYTATFERDPHTTSADDLQSMHLDIDGPRAFGEWLLDVNQYAAEWGKRWNANVKIEIIKNETIKVGEYHMGNDKVIWEDV